MLERDKLVQAFSIAYQNGDHKSAVIIGNEIKRMDEQQALRQQEILDDMSWSEKLAVSAGKGMTNLGRGLQDAYYRATGNEEAVEELAEKTKKENQYFDYLKKDSPVTAFTGEVIGEVGPTLLSAGLVAKGLAGASKAAVYGASAAEGAAIEGLTTQGDIKKRTTTAALGAIGSVGGQYLGNKLSQKLSQRRELRESLQRQLDEIDADIKATQAKALEDGGYQLDSADALATHNALSQKQALNKLEEGSPLREFEAQQHEDIISRANQFIDEIPGEKLTRTGTADDFAENLRARRTEDFKEAGKMYDDWKNTATEAQQPLNTEPFRESIETILAEHDMTARGNVRVIKELLEDYSVIGDKGRKDLTAGSYEELRQKINSLWDKNAKAADNRPIEEIEELMENAIDDILEATPSISREAVELGRAARENYSKVMKKWRSVNVVDKLTSKKYRGSDEFRMKPEEALMYFNRPKNHTDLQKVKSTFFLSDNVEDIRVWNNMRQLPLIEAVAAATKTNAAIAEGGQQLFNTSEFKKSIEKLSPELRRILWGDGDKQLRKALSVWELRGKKVVSAGNDNPSGTANALINIFRNIQGGRGVVGSLIFGKTFIGPMVNKGAIDNLVSGKMTKQVRRDIERKIKEELKELFRAQDILKYDKALTWYSRQLGRELLSRHND